MTIKPTSFRTVCMAAWLLCGVSAAPFYAIAQGADDEAEIPASTNSAEDAMNIFDNIANMANSEVADTLAPQPDEAELNDPVAIEENVDVAPVNDPFAQYREQAQTDEPVVSGQDAGDDPFAKYRQQLQQLDGNGSAQGGEQRDSQGLSQAEMEKTPQELEAEIRKEAFNAAVRGFLPLQPEEIRRFLEIYDETKQAANTPIYPYPKSQSRVEEASLDPAEEPLTVNMATGHVSTVTFLDSTGAPWPIASYTWAGDFEISHPDEGGNAFKMIPLSDYSYGNISIHLLDLGTPLILTLKAQREKVDVRMDVRVAGNGPFAKPSLIVERGPKTKAGSVVMSSFLDGTPPKGSETLKVTGADGRTKAYRLSGKVYLRTPLTLISPAWDASSQSADGMNVYVMDDTPVVLLSDEGKIERVFLDDRENNSSL